MSYHDATLSVDMHGKWLLISVAAVLAGAGGAALSLHWKGRTNPPVRKTGAALIQTAGEATLSGKLRPQHVTTVKSEVDGDIDAFLVDVGEDVFTGEVLARIGNSGLANRRDAAAAAVSAAEDQVSKAEQTVANARLEASRAEADQQRSRAALDKMRAVYERQQMLNKAGATPRLTWEKAQRDFESAQQEYDAMDKAARLSAGQLQSALNDLGAAQKAAADRNQEAANRRAGPHAIGANCSRRWMARWWPATAELGGPAGADLFEIATDMYRPGSGPGTGPASAAAAAAGPAATVLIPDLQSAGMPGQIKEIQGNRVVVEFNCTLAAVRPGMPVEVRLKLQ